MNDDTDTADAGPRFPRWLTWGLIGALVVLVVGYGVIFLYAKVINDSPDELDSGDLDAALAADEPADEPAEEPASAPEPATSEPESSEPAPVATTAPSDVATATVPLAEGAQEWVVTDASSLGYRVKEVLFGVDTEAVGRTNQITGSFVIDGTSVAGGEFVVDVASITSDESRRDGQFRGRIMTTDEFPTAVFTLTQPIELGTDVAEGATVSTEATGDLTLRGVTNSVTFPLEAKLENGKIGVLGNIPVLFADYGIENPSIGGITTEDNGLLEFVLVFEPA